jgi:4'-phosphopantetheinyl transferase
LKDVFVWSIALAEHDRSAASAWPLLGAEERSIADRFHHASDRDRYIAAHGGLRAILARHVNDDPAHLRFDVAPRGKPALHREPGWPDLRFNLSHSGDIALCAVTSGREVGIDIERIDPNRAGMTIAERFFSPDEVARLRRLSEADRERGFLNCWTRKEAYLKGRAEGLWHSLAEFDVSLAPGEPAALLRSRRIPTDVGRWSLHELAVPSGYVGALAIESGGSVVRLSYRAYPRDLANVSAGTKAMQRS